MAEITEEKKKVGFFRRLMGRGGAGAEESKPAVGGPEGENAPRAEAMAEAEAAPVAAPVAAGEVAGPSGPTAEAAAGGMLAIEPEAAEDMKGVEEATVEEKKAGFFSRLKNRLSRTRTGLVDRVLQVISLRSKVDDDLIEEIEMILVQADVGIETTSKIVERMRRHSEARKADSSEALARCFKDALLEIVRPAEKRLALTSSGPTVMLVVGVNGVGKTTTIGKIASQLRAQGKKVMMVAGDTFRAAAIEQLSIWAERTGSAIVKQSMGADPGSVCYDALTTAQSQGFDVVLIDTAGRLHTKSDLMEELRKVCRVIQKVIPDAPHETLLVLDATTGQNALNQAKIFGEVVALTGLIMTKLDGTAKGGVLIALADQHKVPVVKIGIGESEEDLRDFDAQAYVEALFSS